MSASGRCWLAGVALLAACESVESAESTESVGPTTEPASILHIDPFEKPELSPRERPADSEERIEIPEPPPWTPELRAIVAAPDRSLVNLDGLVLEVGESYQGFRLVEVREREAVFHNGDLIRTLSLDD